MVSTIQTSQMEASMHITKKEAKRKFSAALTGLVKNMRAVFPDDVGLAVLEQKVSTLLKKQATSSMPLLAFAKTLSECKTVPDMASMIMTKDEKVLLDPVVSIPILESISIAKKWTMLTEENKQVVWQLLQLMVTSSMTFMTLDVASAEELVQIYTECMQTPDSSCKLGEQLQRRIATTASDAMKAKEDKK